MKILVIQHSAADTPAAAGEIVQRLGHSLAVARTVEMGGDPIPTKVEADALLLFGGPASLSTPQQPDWIETERKLVRKYADAGKHVMGICLGSQIVASAFGATVTRNREREVGWHLITRVDSDSEVAEAFPRQFMAFHWHQDTFGIPEGAQCILKSEGCDHQGFMMDDRVCGFQCHLEANQRTVDIFMMVSKMHQQSGIFVQSEPMIRHGAGLYLAKQTGILSNFLRRWLS